MKDPLKTEKLPPHDIPAEQGVLGCILMSPNDSINLCLEKFKTSEVFFDLRHRTIYEAMLAMHADRVPIDTITLRSELSDSCQLESVGGLAYIASLPDAAPSAANIDHYIEILIEKHTIRKAIAFTTEFSSRAYEHQGEVDSLIEELQHDVRSLSSGEIQSTLKSASELVPVAIDAIELAWQNQGQLSGIATGFVDFDSMTGGLQNGDMIVIAARPSQGKSAWCLNVADYVAVNLNLPVAFFSVEMTAASLMIRAMCSRGRVNMGRVRDGQLFEGDFAKLTSAAEQLRQAPLYIDEAGALTVAQLGARARRMKEQYGIRLVMVDYLQLLRPSKKADSRQQEVTDISSSIKALAKELNIPVIAVSQLNRESEKDKKKRKPRLSDIRESGSIEQDADLVGLLYKPEQEDNEDPEDGQQSDAEAVNLLIAKQRNGPTGDVRMVFLRQFVRFENAAPTT